MGLLGATAVLGSLGNALAPWLTVVTVVAFGLAAYLPARRRARDTTVKDTADELERQVRTLERSLHLAEIQGAENRTKIQEQERSIELLRSMAMTQEAWDRAMDRMASMQRELVNSLLSGIGAVASQASDSGVQTVLAAMDRRLDHMERTYLVPLSTGAVVEAWKEPTASGAGKEPT